MNILELPVTKGNAQNDVFDSLCSQVHHAYMDEKEYYSFFEQYMHLEPKRVLYIFVEKYNSYLNSINTIAFAINPSNRQNLVFELFDLSLYSAYCLELLYYKATGKMVDIEDVFDAIIQSQRVYSSNNECFVEKNKHNGLDNAARETYRAINREVSKLNLLAYKSINGSFVIGVEHHRIIASIGVYSVMGVMLLADHAFGGRCGLSKEFVV